MATETLKLSFRPNIGISSARSHNSSRFSGTPSTSSPRSRAIFAFFERVNCGSLVEVLVCSSAKISKP